MWHRLFASKNPPYLLRYATMHINREKISPTTTKLTITAEGSELTDIKERVVSALSRNVKVPGFRAGKAPSHIIEKNLDQSALQTEFLEQAVNKFYIDAVQQESLRPAAQPTVEITKFVPFTTLEFTATVETVGEIKLADYKILKLKPEVQTVTADDVNEVIENLRKRSADKVDVAREAKNGDEVLIDFEGVDAKSKEPIEGADGKDYPLQLGSKTFIPGFEDELVGLKAGEEKTFSLTFPKDYGVASLQEKKVEFKVGVKQVQELQLPKLDDELASKVGPFTSVAELKADIKKQLAAEREQEANRLFDNRILEKIAEKSSVDIPPSLVDEEIDRMEEEEKRNVVYRGQTWQEHLAAEGVTAEAHREKQRPGAQLRIKAGLLLAEIAEKENVEVTPEELEIRVQLLKGQYPDAAMQAEIDKPENRRDIHSRMLTEKTLQKLRDYATS